MAELVPEPMSEQQTREFLALHHVPQFVDTFVQNLIKYQPDDWRPLLKELIGRVERHSGKGVKAVAAAEEYIATGTVAPTKALKYGGDPFADLGLGEWNIPDHCRRDPNLKPSTYQVRRKYHITSLPTESVIKPPQQKKDYATSIAAQFNYAAQECKEACEKIKSECQSAGKAFWDDKFWYGKRDTMYPKGCPSDCTVTEPRKAMKASELYPKAPLFVDGVDAADIVQGAVGDCFFIGAVSALASCTAKALEPTKRLFVYENAEYGIYGVCWFKNGGWEWVIVDDWIAVSQDRKGNVWPQYASPLTAEELWPLIIEKAYAKVHKCWDSIDGGWLRYALEDLTGGLAYTLDLYKNDRRTYGQDVKAFKALCDDPLSIVGCAVGWHVKDAGGSGRAGEQGAVYGLFKGHAYSVLACKETSDGKAFVRVRNPWGNEAEWSGPYSDTSSDWNRNPTHKRELAPELKADGAFWMPWDMFKEIFTDIDVVRFFKYDYTCLSMFGTAPRYDLTPENTYILKVGETLDKVIVSMGQDDPQTKSDHHTRKNGRFSDMQLSCYKLTELPSDYKALPNCLDRKVETEKCKTRTSFHELDLEPGYYSLVPRIFNAYGVGYYVRVFAEANSNISIFRFSDGESKALSVVQAVANAQEVPAIHVPTVIGGEVAADTRPATVVTSDALAGVDSEEAASVSATLGFSSQAEYDQLLTEAFSKQDRYGRGKLDRNRCQKAIEEIITRNKKVTDAFKTKWEELEKGSYYYRIRLQEFKGLMEELLMTLAKP